MRKNPPRGKNSGGRAKNRASAIVTTNPCAGTLVVPVMGVANAFAAPFSCLAWGDLVMKLARRLFLSLVMIACAAPIASAKDHVLKGENTTLKFVGSKKDGKHSGQFPKLEGKIEMPGDDATKAKITLTIDMTALTSDNPMLTAHLKNADFFEVKKYPEAKFVSTKIEVTGDHEYKITGDLTLRGKTAPITFPLKFVEKDGEHLLKGEWKLERSKWGITYGKGMINDEVDMSVEIKLE